MFSFWDIVIFVITCVIVIWYYGLKKYKYFDGAGIKYEKPTIPFVGSMVKLILRKENFSQFIKKHYDLFPNEKYVGIFEGTKPIILVRDLEILKNIGTKHFDHFPNHENIISEDLDPFFGKILIFLQDDKWKDMRGTLSPAFTSSKMKNMYIFIEECAKEFILFYKDKCKVDQIVEIEIKDALTRYTNDVIANSVFGLKVNSLKDQNNEFYQLSKKATNFTGLQTIKFMGYSLFPKLMKLLKIHFVNAKAQRFFQTIIENTMKIREEKSIRRNDMIQLLIEAKKGSLKHDVDDEKSDIGFATTKESTIGKQEVKRTWNDDDLIPQAFIFLIGGFETLSTLITFFLYEMVCNPDIQKQVQQEIDNFLSTHDKITYNDLPYLKYLDKCVSETLRIWPPSFNTDRVCKKTYTLPPPNENSTKTHEISPGYSVWIPIYAFHHDSKYFPNPEKFDPERFSEENKSSEKIQGYLPFGIGPRNCIGSRFALMAGKLIVFHILSTFDIVATSKTQIPITLDKSALNLTAKGGIYLGLRLRSPN